MRTSEAVQRILIGFTLAVAAATNAAGATEIGTFVAVRGVVEVRRASAGEWKVASTGAAIYAADEIRSDARGRAKLLFKDACVVDLGGESDLTIKRYDGTSSANVISLARGRLRVFLSDTDRPADARFEVETPTASVRAEGTVFLVDYVEAEKITHVYGVDGTVDVQGAIGLIGPSLKVGAGEQTRVQEGKFPEPVEASEVAAITAMTDDLAIIGTGGSDGIAATHGLLAGAITRSDEKPAAIAVRASTTRSDVSYLAPEAPGETLLHRLSPDARANTQPIPEYEF
jgi:hypothetical protein